MIRDYFPILSLCACLLAGPAFGAPPHTTSDGAADQGLIFDPQTGEFTKPPAKIGGWQAFADLLKKATPSVNTEIPLTPSQVTDHIASLIDSGHPQAALDVIEQRQAARKQQGTIGTDVQLMYQHGRALAALGRHDEAIATWRKMTEDFPELPEPWNALAIEYARRGELYRARDALDMALVSDPKFAPALENLGHIQMRLAEESFARAHAAQGKKAAPSPAPATEPDDASMQNPSGNPEPFPGLNNMGPASEAQ